MKILKLLLLIYVSLFSFADNSYLPKSKIVDSKIVDGTKYYIVQANADIMNTFTADGKPRGTLSLVYANLAGKVAVSKKAYKQLPNLERKKIDIYYLIKEGEEEKQSHQVVFKREDINFPIYSLDKDNKFYGKNTPYQFKSKTNYNAIYFILFSLFLMLIGFTSNNIYSIIPIRIRCFFITITRYFSIPTKILFFMQAVIIIIFFIGINKVINIENNECSQNIIHTKGTIRYFLNNEPYVVFKNCNRDNSRSQMNIEALKGYNEYAAVDIYYSQESQEGSVDNRGHTFTYKVYFSKDEFLEKSETPFRKKVAYFMLFIWLLSFFDYKKETREIKYNRN